MALHQTPVSLDAPVLGRLLRMFPSSLRPPWARPALSPGPTSPFHSLVSCPKAVTALGWGPEPPLGTALPVPSPLPVLSHLSSVSHRKPTVAPTRQPRTHSDPFARETTDGGKTQAQIRLTRVRVASFHGAQGPGGWFCHRTHCVLPAAGASACHLGLELGCTALGPEPVE